MCLYCTTILKGTMNTTFENNLRLKTRDPPSQQSSWLKVESCQLCSEISQWSLWQGWIPQVVSIWAFKKFHLRTFCPRNPVPLSTVIVFINILLSSLNFSIKGPAVRSGSIANCLRSPADWNLMKKFVCQLRKKSTLIWQNGTGTKAEEVSCGKEAAREMIW